MKNQHSGAAKILQEGLNKLNFGFFLGERLRMLEEQLLRINTNGATPSEVLILKGRILEIKELLEMVDKAGGEDL